MIAENIWSFYEAFSAKIACIWLSAWAIRKKAEVDYPLGPTSRTVRWTIVILGFAAGYYVEGPDLGYVRVIAGFVALAFLCWPNLAVHLTNVFKVTEPNGTNDHNR